MINFDKVFTVAKEVTQDQFLRKLLITLASKKDAPYDVCNAEFKDIHESVKEVIVGSAHVEMGYSASIGYDRIEEYWDKEKTSEYVNGRRIEYLADVQKTRVVTDWHPYSGCIIRDVSCIVLNEEGYQNAPKENNRLVPVFKSIKTQSFALEGNATVSLQALDAVKYNCETLVKSEINFPGDQTEGEVYNAKTQVKTLVCYKLPYYEVEFVYQDKKYLASGFACGDPNVETEIPPNNVNIEQSVYEKVESYKVGSIFSWIGCFICFMIALFGDQSNVQWAWVFALSLLVLAIVLSQKKNEKYNELTKKLNDENKKQKLDNLVNALELRKYSELTEDETSAFSTDPTE